MTSRPTSKARPNVTASKMSVGCETYQARARVNHVNKMLNPRTCRRLAGKRGHNSA